MQMRDTINIADDLNAAGFDNQQARAIMSAHAKAGAEYATKSDLVLLAGRFDVLTARMDAMDKWSKFGVGLLAAIFLKLFLG